ncbi:HVO_2523 family zinc finger protein [Halopiger goleimassiliensis]|uniref:HVO_2523 family zinc finger protein n=1 Tax=Halopiger goleimassiliensis TaxID=1293048 RepID=UPI000AB00600|nr:HVO_2523 family zinc finger protein [Halopiger goleimassiliensis]
MSSGDEGTDRGSSDGPLETGANGAPTCPHCEALLYERHCKYVCPQHGPIIDCSDPFL